MATVAIAAPSPRRGTANLRRVLAEATWLAGVSGPFRTTTPAQAAVPIARRSASIPLSQPKTRFEFAMVRDASLGCQMDATLRSPGGLCCPFQTTQKQERPPGANLMRRLDLPASKRVPGALDSDWVVNRAKALETARFSRSAS